MPARETVYVRPRPTRPAFSSGRRGVGKRGMEEEEQGEEGEKMEGMEGEGGRKEREGGTSSYSSNV